jgi:hypothetical protein
VTYQPQRKIEFLPVSRVSIIGHPHGVLPVQFKRFWVKKNLTEICHKVSLLAKGIFKIKGGDLCRSHS